MCEMSTLDICIIHYCLGHWSLLQLCYNLPFQIFVNIFKTPCLGWTSKHTHTPANVFVVLILLIHLDLWIHFFVTCLWSHQFCFSPCCHTQFEALKLHLVKMEVQCCIVFSHYRHQGQLSKQTLTFHRKADNYLPAPCVNRRDETDRRCSSYRTCERANIGDIQPVICWSTSAQVHQWATIKSYQNKSDFLILKELTFASRSYYPLVHTCCPYHLLIWFWCRCFMQTVFLFCSVDLSHQWKHLAQQTMSEIRSSRF